MVRSVNCYSQFDTIILQSDVGCYHPLTAQTTVLDSAVWHLVRPPGGNIANDNAAHFQKYFLILKPEFCIANSAADNRQI
jgi:hypothetical protein